MPNDSQGSTPTPDPFDLQTFDYSGATYGAIIANAVLDCGQTLSFFLLTNMLAEIEDTSASALRALLLDTIRACSTKGQDGTRANASPTLFAAAAADSSPLNTMSVRLFFALLCITQNLKQEHHNDNGEHSRTFWDIIHQHRDQFPLTLLDTLCGNNRIPQFQGAKIQWDPSAFYAKRLNETMLAAKTAITARTATEAEAAEAEAAEERGISLTN